MPRSDFLGAAALVALAGLGACTQDFDQFEPRSASGAGGTSTTMATSSGGGEDCLNGQDDNGDGTIDCADASCDGFACVDVPASWEGPVVLYEGAQNQLPECPADFPTQVDVGGTGIVASTACTPCTCGAPDVICLPSQVFAYRSDTCNGPGSPSFQPPTADDCYPLGGAFTFNSYRVEPADSLPTGDCTPSVASPTGPEPTFGAAGRICALREGGGGCSAATSCSPTAIGAPFEGGGVCVWRDGDHRCPDGFAVPHVFATNLVDNRGCGQCACGAPDARCDATTTIYDDPFCRAPVATVTNDGLCDANAHSGEALTVSVVASASCTPTGGEPSGSVDPAGEITTVCCQR